MDFFSLNIRVLSETGQLVKEFEEPVLWNMMFEEVDELIFENLGIKVGDDSASFELRLGDQIFNKKMTFEDYRGGLAPKIEEDGHLDILAMLVAKVDDGESKYASIVSNGSIVSVVKGGAGVDRGFASPVDEYIEDSGVGKDDY